MANRVLRDWTEDQIVTRISEIDAELLSMPKAEGAHRHLQSLKWALYSEKRRHNVRLAKLKGSHSFKEGVEFMKAVGYKCSRCGSDLNPTLDHIIPVSKGGSDSLTNKAVLCSSCNSSKGNRYGK